MSESLTARIVEWNADKGYGFVDTGTRRVFLHVRDFAERHKRPEVGDVIVFTLGTDSQGRTCAVHAVHHNDGGRIRLWHLLLLLALLVSPGLAIWRLAPIVNVPLLLGLWALVSLVTYALYASDRQRARAGEWRVPEAMLHFAELVGGWPGAFLAQRRLRHKCAKLGFQVVFWLIVAIHVYAATDYQLNWRLARSAQQFLHQGRTEPGKP